MDTKRFKYKYVLKRHARRSSGEEQGATAADCREATQGCEADRSLTAMLEDDIKDFLATNKSLFFNERDIQVTLSLYLTNSKRYDSVDMEYSLPMEELEARVEGFGTDIFPWRNNMSVDIVVEKGGMFVPIELKYATRPVDKEILRFGERMKTDALIIKNQAASNLTMYNYWKDVRRLETLCRLFPAVSGGIALLVTNNSTYWHKPQDDSNYRAFATTEGRVMEPGRKDWGDGTSANIIATHPSFCLDGAYTCRWEDTAIEAFAVGRRDKVPFRYLITNVKNK